jgi:hypothetical protein
MSDTDADGDGALISAAIRKLCLQLRTNDPLILRRGSKLTFSNYVSNYSDATRSTVCDFTEAESVEVFQALEENTNVKHIDFELFERRCTNRNALAAAEYLESSKTLLTLQLGYDRHFQELSAVIPLFVIRP